jgi:hypothetical protein
MTIFFVVNGRQREPVQVSPMSMTKLGDIVDQKVLVKINSRGKQNTGAGGEAPISSFSSSPSYKLFLKKKELDCSLPIRFAGLKDRDTLDLLLRQPTTTTTTTTTTTGTSGSDGGAIQKQQRTGGAATAPPIASGGSASKEAAPPPKPKPVTSPPPPTAIGNEFDRNLIVFHKDVVKATASGNTTAGSDGPGDLPEDFYEFTAQDFAKIQSVRAQQNKGEQAKTLQTRAMREKARLEKARSMAPVRLRIVLQDGWCLQCVFRATERVGDIYRFVSGLVLVDLSSFELFTTPPKSVLSKTSKETLYDANLVPSAKIYFTLKGTSTSTINGNHQHQHHHHQQILSSDVVQRYSVHTPEQVAAHGKQLNGKGGTSYSQSESVLNKKKGVEGTSSSSQGAGGGQQNQNKKKPSGLPKWFSKGGK